MAIKLQLRRGSNIENDTFTGASGEVTVDLDRKTLRVHDGITPGGTETARSNLSNARVGVTLTPTQDNLYELGSINLRFKKLFLNESISLGTTLIESDASGLRITTNSGVVTLDETAEKLRTPRTISTTGDVIYTSQGFDGSSNVSGVATLATVNNNVGTHGSATQIPILTVNAKGLVTSVGTATIQFPTEVQLPDIITPGTFGGNSKTPVITVNAQGLITGISDVDSLGLSFQIKPNIAARDAIPNDQRISGMLVLTQDTNDLWQLKSDLLTWQEYFVHGARKTFTHPVGDIDPYSVQDFTLPLGRAVLVYKLSVNVACTVEVHEDVNRSDTNPFKFVATAGHLVDDGSTLLSDGSLLRGRRYHIWANLEQNENIYFRVINPTDTAITGVTVTATYMPIEINAML